MDDSTVEEWSQAGPLITRLRGLDLLDEEELTALGRLFTTPHQVGPGIDIVAEGMPHDYAWAVSDGWAMGYRNLADGRRQILEFIVPGDIFGLFAPVTPHAEYGVESITTAKAYAFEPVPEELNDEAAAHILGLEGNLWTEHIADRDRLDYQTFPRLCALAEVAWSPQAARNWENFRLRLKRHGDRLARLGVQYWHDPEVW